MKFDFESIIDRTGKDSSAANVIPIPGATVKEGFSKIPMWVADMNFATAPTIPEAMIKRAEHPLYGYFPISDEYYDAIIKWHADRHHATVTKEAIGYENGVLGGVATALQAFTAPGEPILIHSPTYIGFTGTITNNGRKIVHSELYRDEEGVWRMDYEDMDKKIKENHIHVCIFCNPHNPCGRVWTREEIEKAMEVYKNNNCIVISDEIWADLVMNGNVQTPTQEISEDAKMRTIALYAPSKTFNLAGLVGSYHVIFNKYLRERMDKVASLSHYNSINVMSMHALVRAYRETGREWVAELLEVLSSNVNYAYGYICKNFKGVKLAKPEGTYMLYLDCEEWCKEHNMSMDDLLKAGVAVGVIWQDGRPFNRPFAIRVNLAVPHSRVIDAMDRLDKYVFNAK